MRIKDVVGGFDDVVIFEVDDGLFAIVDVGRKSVNYNWYWLFVAKYEAVYSEDQLDEEIVQQAVDLLRESEIDGAEKQRLIEQAKGDKEHYLASQQKKLIEQSEQKQKGIYLSD